MRCCAARLWYATLIVMCVRWGVAMQSWGLWDMITGGCVFAAALVIAIDGAISQSEHLRRHVPRLLKGYVAFLPLGLLFVGGSAFAYQQLRPTDILALPKGAEIGSPFGLVQAWGSNNDVFYMVVKTDSIETEKKLSKLVLIVRVPFSDIDKMTDTNIKKSQTYTILDGFMTLAVPISNGTPWRVPVDRPTPLEYDLVQLPFLYSADQIRSLSDVEKLGGKILASPGASMTFSTTSAPSNPGACPPIQSAQPRKS